jgi:hypothetical protein
MAANVCVCAVVGFRSRHCPRGQTLNEDNTLNLLVTPPLRKHFVGGCKGLLESLLSFCPRYFKFVLVDFVRFKFFFVQWLI